MKVGLVLEGGGLRGVFTSGALDYLMEQNLHFDYVIGVSAGSCNAFEYIGDKKKFFINCVKGAQGKDSFFGVRQMIESHKIVDLDKVFDEYAKKQHLSYKKFLNSSCEWEFVVTNIETGKAEYLHDYEDIEKALLIAKASCSLPILTSPREIDGSYYLDGGVADSIPIKRAFKMGCDKVLVITTRRKGLYPHLSEKELALAGKLYKKYPNFIETMKNRERVYRNSKRYIERKVKENKAIELCPSLPEISRLETDEDKIVMYYYHGRVKAKENYQDIVKLMRQK